MDVTTKYAQREVLYFWRQFGRQRLQEAESHMLQMYAPPPARVLDLGCGAGRAFAPRVRQLDKQVFYAFQRES